MMFKTALVALASLSVVTEASVIKRIPADRATVSAAAGNNNNNNGGTSTCLSANALQTGSFSTGQVNDVAADGQSNSETDQANFINFCSGETLTNGLQVKTGSCNGIVMGKIPATSAMVSTVILNPKLNDNLEADQTFNVTATIANLQLGTFTNATSTYYSAPQDLSGSGEIIGHTHITIQDVGSSFQFTTPLDATQFVFFKGINDAGNGQGTVTTAVTGGLPAGNYRVCTMSSSANHQPVLMPVAQRGAQDDCRYFSVGGTGNTNTGNANTGNTGNTASSASSAAASKTSTKASTASTASTTSAASTTAASTASASATSVASTPNTAASAIGGIAAPAVTSSGDSSRPFAVNGDTFVNEAVALQRACSIQNNLCANAVNSGQLSGFTVGDCNTQQQACSAQA